MAKEIKKGKSIDDILGDLLEDLGILYDLPKEELFKKLNIPKEKMKEVELSLYSSNVIKREIADKPIVYFAKNPTEDIDLEEMFYVNNVSKREKIESMTENQSRQLEYYEYLLAKTEEFLKNEQDPDIKRKLSKIIKEAKKDYKSLVSRASNTSKKRGIVKTEKGKVKRQYSRDSFVGSRKSV